MKSASFLSLLLSASCASSVAPGYEDSSADTSPQDANTNDSPDAATDTIVPPCQQLQELGRDSAENVSPNAQFACSSRDTCMFLGAVNRQPMQRMYQSDGTSLPGHIIPQITDTQELFSFLISTAQGGYLTSVWENTGPNTVTNWLVRTDENGVPIQAARTPGTIGSSVRVGVSTALGEWAGDAGWRTAEMRLNYQFGSVDTRTNQITGVESFSRPGTYTRVGGIAQIGDVIGMAAAWSSTEGEGISLFLKNMSNGSLQEVALATPRTSSGHNYVLRLIANNQNFVALWRKDIPGAVETYLSVVARTGQIISTTRHDGMLDIATADSGYVIARMDQVARAIFVDRLTANFDVIAISPGYPASDYAQPVVAVSGAGRVALMFVEGLNGVAHLAFLGCR